MATNKIKKATSKVKDAQQIAKDIAELVATTKFALLEAKKLVEKVKELVDENDFPELKDIKIPSFGILKKSDSNKSIIEQYDAKKVDWFKLEAGLVKYQQIMSSFYEVDVSKDPSFQKLFNGFYKIRQRPKAFYSAIYMYLEKNKNAHVSFQSVLEHLFGLFDRIEPSFSSKIAATLNPNLPVWDSVVLNHLSLKSPGYHMPTHIRLTETINIYNEISSFYMHFLNGKQANRMISDFNNRFPHANISDIKKVDLILWQSRI